MDDEKMALVTHDAVAIFGTEALSWQHGQRIRRLTSFWNEFWKRNGGDGDHPIVRVYADDEG